MNHSFYYLKMTGQHEPEWVGQHSRNIQIHRGKVFYRLVQQAVATPPIPLKDLIDKKKSLHVRSR